MHFMQFPCQLRCGAIAPGYPSVQPQGQHRETVAALQAWKSRADAYNAVWDADLSGIIDRAVCPLLFGCAEDDVLWQRFEDACKARHDAGRVTLAGGNFEPDRYPAACAAAANAFADGHVRAIGHDSNRLPLLYFCAKFSRLQAMLASSERTAGCNQYLRPETSGNPHG
jgi:hypothetical protein